MKARVSEADGKVSTVHRCVKNGGACQCAVALLLKTQTRDSNISLDTDSGAEYNGDPGRRAGYLVHFQNYCDLHRPFQKRIYKPFALFSLPISEILL